MSLEAVLVDTERRDIEFLFSQEFSWSNSRRSTLHEEIVTSS